MLDFVTSCPLKHPGFPREGHKTSLRNKAVRVTFCIPKYRNATVSLRKYKTMVKAWITETRETFEMSRIKICLVKNSIK